MLTITMHQIKKKKNRSTANIDKPIFKAMTKHIFKGYYYMQKLKARFFLLAQNSFAKRPLNVTKGKCSNTRDKH